MPFANIEDKRASRRRDNKRRTREQRRDEKRRQRARWRAAGLNASGKPVVRPDLQLAADVRYGRHPSGCLCYDCLWR